MGGCSTQGERKVQSARGDGLIQMLVASTPDTELMTKTQGVCGKEHACACGKKRLELMIGVSLQGTNRGLLLLVEKAKTLSAKFAFQLFQPLLEEWYRLWS